MVPGARRFLALIGAAGAGDPSDIQALRRSQASLADLAAPPPGVERREARIALQGRSLPARIHGPAGLPGLVWLHGGGLVSGDLDSCDALCATLSVEAACRVVSIAYRLAPEHKFPAAHEDALAAYEAVAAEPRAWGWAGRLAIGGDSAGANLAVYVARVARRRPDLLLMLCPALDPEPETPSRAELSSGYLIGEATLRAYWQAYRVDGLSPRDPAVAPRFAPDLARLPPTFVHGAEHDPLRDEAKLFAEAASRAGVSVSAEVHAGLIHNFYGLGAIVPQGADALNRIARGFGEALASA